MNMKMAKTTTSTEVGRLDESLRNRRSAGVPSLLLVAAFGVLAAACGESAPPDAEAPEPAAWSVTAWGALYEVFPECPPLEVGRASRAAVHVTVLEGFEPLEEGDVGVILADAGGAQEFLATTPARDGIFMVDVEPTRAGEFDLELRVTSEAGTETIRGGRVRVGASGSPGALLRAPAPRGSLEAGEPLPFLKEEQWRSEFGTIWVRAGSLAASVPALAEVRPRSSGDSIVAAPVAGLVLAPSPGGWPNIGQNVAAQQTLFRVAPRVKAGDSLAALEADVLALSEQHRAARDRLGRLEELLALDAVSTREVEALRTEVVRLEAAEVAARRDQAAALATRGGSGAADGVIEVKAPFSGAIAEVAVRRGEATEAGSPLARLVRTGVVWLELQMSPLDATRLQRDGVAGVVLSVSGHEPIREEEGVRLVAVSPEVDPENGSVTVLLELQHGVGLAFGTHANAEVLLGVATEGVVVPSSAVIDDGGVDVVYLQLTGERFARQTVDVIARQGELVLVGNLLPGQRLVHLGGEAIRRSSLMGSGQAHGHVH